MSFEKRNKNAAVSRWSKIHEKEMENISKDSGMNYLRARLCGFVAGDGSVMVRKDNRGSMHYVLRFFPDHESLIKPFSESLMKLYGKKPIVKENFSRQGVICYSKVVVEDILRMGKFGILKWRIPFNILTDERSKIEWLRAFFDTEGYVNNDQIKIQTVNKKGMGDLRKLLMEFDIVPKKYVYNPKNKKWNTVYILHIGTKEDRLKFLNTIGFNHSLKKRKLRQHAWVA